MNKSETALIIAARMATRCGASDQEVGSSVDVPDLVELARRSHKKKNKRVGRRRTQG